MQDLTTHVGIDAHKKQHSLAMLLPGGDGPKEWSIASSAAEVRRMVRQVKKQAPGPVVFCYEAGVCGFALKRRIEAEGARCIVIAPSLTPVKPGQRVQTDRRDARNLAFYLRAGMLTEVYPPTEEQESVRDLVRCRDSARRDLMRIRHQVGKFLLRRGVQSDGGKNWTKGHMRWLREVRFERPVDEVVFRDYLGELDRRVSRLEGLDEQVERVSRSEAYAEVVGWLRCYRGVDVVTAMTILTELYDFRRFGSGPQFMSFLGLTPSESSSGESRRTGRITRAGNERVRRVLLEAAWHHRHAPRNSKRMRERRAGQPDWVVRKAEQAERRLHRRYWRLVGGNKMPVKAATAVARELAGYIWATVYYRGPAPGDASRKVHGENRRVSAREFFMGSSGQGGVSKPERPDDSHKGSLSVAEVAGGGGSSVPS